MEEFRLPKEFSEMPAEDGPLVESANMPVEFDLPAEPQEETTREFEGKSGGEESETARLHKLIKRLILVPVASTVATISIVFASFGHDPLGDDFLNQDEYGTEESDSAEKSGRDKTGGDESGDKHKAREYPGDITGVYIDVTYVPTGDSYRAQETGEEGLAEAKSWVKSQGGDPDTMTFVREESIDLGYEYSDDSILVGDPDDPENIYVAQGTRTRKTGKVAYFEAYAAEEKGGTNDGTNVAVIEGLPISVIFVPTDETYYPVATGEEGIQEAKDWLRSIGADPDSLTFVTIRREKKYELEDGVLSQILTDFAHYEATEYADGYSEDDETFPALPNQDPDFDGEYAWGGMGSEEYLRIFMSDKSTLYLEAGGYWKNNEGAVESSLPTCSYDRNTNTLTLQGFNDSEAVLDVNLMGNGFKIRLVGENHIGSIQVWGAMYAGSVTFIGSGSLYINEAHPELGTGILLNAEGSESCVMVGSKVYLEIHGDHQIAVYDTQAADPIVMNGTMHIVGGEIYSNDMQYNETISAYLHECGVSDSTGDHKIVIEK